MGGDTRGRRLAVPSVIPGFADVDAGNGVGTCTGTDADTGIDIDAVLGLTGGGEGGRACPDPAGNGARAGMFAPVTPDMTPDKAPPIPPPLIKPVTMPPRPADSDFAADALVVLFEPAAAASPWVRYAGFHRRAVITKIG